MIKTLRIVLFIVLALFVGCTQDNNPPELTDIDISPDCIAVGGTATIQLTVRDADGDDIAFSWSNGMSGNPISIAPAEVGEYRITVTISDGKDDVTSNIVIDKIHPTNPELIVTFSDDDSVDCDLYLVLSSSGDTISSSTSSGNQESIQLNLIHNTGYGLFIACVSGLGDYTLTVSGDFVEQATEFNSSMDVADDAIDQFSMNNCSGVQRID